MPLNLDTADLALILIGLFGLVQVLRALAIRVRNDVAVHDLRVRVAQLQAKNYHATMLRHGMVPRADAVSDVEVLDDPREDDTPRQAQDALEIGEVPTQQPARRAA